MKGIYQWLLFAQLFLMSISGYAQTALTNKEIFRLGDVEVGVTTFDEIQAKFGKAPIFRVDRNDESPIQICYLNSSIRGKAFIVFESGPMGGFKQVTGIRITMRPPGKNCTSTSADIFSIASGNGVQLGQSRQDFLRKFNIKFRRAGDKLVYEGESKREATKEELDRLRTYWPNEKQTFFDVTINIDANFKNNRLNDYFVGKVESY